MAHKYHLPADRKVDASTQGLGNHHTLFDFETMSEYYAKVVFVDRRPADLGETLDPAVILRVNGEGKGEDRDAFCRVMGELCAPLQHVEPTMYGDWPDLHVYVTSCPVEAKRADGTAVTFANTMVFGDPPEHKIVEWIVKEAS